MKNMENILKDNMFEIKIDESPVDFNSDSIKKLIAYRYAELIATANILLKKEKDVLAEEFLGLSMNKSYFLKGNVAYSEEEIDRKRYSFPIRKFLKVFWLTIYGGMLCINLTKKDAFICALKYTEIIQSKFSKQPYNEEDLENIIVEAYNENKGNPIISKNRFLSYLPFKEFETSDGKKLITYMGNTKKLIYAADFIFRRRSHVFQNSMRAFNKFKKAAKEYRILSLYFSDEALSTKEISEIVGMSQQTIRNYINRAYAKISFFEWPEYRMSKKEASILNDRRKNMKIKDIAKKYKVSNAYVSKTCRKYAYLYSYYVDNRYVQARFLKEENFSNKEIGKKLNLSESFVSRILKKMRNKIHKTTNSILRRNEMNLNLCSRAYNRAISLISIRVKNLVGKKFQGIICSKINF